MIAPDDWNEEIENFLVYCQDQGVRLIMVGGGAVNFHGYKRHSADVDFWIDSSSSNLKALVKVLNMMGYEIDRFPENVEKGFQNISLKFSPQTPDIELITNFSANKPYENAFSDSILTSNKNKPKLKWRVLNYEDLITSKIKAGRPKDLVDVQELKRIRNNE